jgi:hypothetical protein
MVTWRARVWRWLRSALDDTLPMPAKQRDERDWTPMGDGEASQRRLQRLRLHMLEKRGKGGFR